MNGLILGTGGGVRRGKVEVVATAGISVEDRRGGGGGAVFVEKEAGSLGVTGSGLAEITFY